MKNNGTTSSAPSRHRLVCPECAHDQRFIQVMYEEAHWVDRDFNYVDLIEGVVDHYICSACGASFEFDECSNR